MDEIWKKYDKQTIFADKKKGGLFVTFLKQYRDEFKVQVNASCSSCFETYYRNYLNSIKPKETMSKKNVKCDYELHKKYENIYMKFNGKRIRNRDLTNELGKEISEKHPHGAKLFVKMPKQAEQNVADTDLTFTQLKAKYPEISTNSKKNFLIKLKAGEEE